MLHSILYKVGVKLRSPLLFERYKFLKDSEKWSLDKLQLYQLHELQKIICFAYEKSPFYKRLYDDVGINPFSINSLQDLNKLPIINKSDLIINNLDIQICEKGNRKFYSYTSGSTGEPFVFYRNSKWDNATRALQLRGYSWYGVKPWEKNGYLKGFSYDKLLILKTKILDFLLNRYRLFSYNDIEIKRFQKKLKHSIYLEGFSSMIYEVAKLINASSTKYSFNLKMVKGTSEKIYENYQDEVRKAFGKKMISEYGACETGIIAFECPYGNMHIAMEDVIVEEENGEIIVTNLVSYSFPIIRYRLGDAVKLDLGRKCACGMQHQILSDVIGRVGKVIYGVKHTYPSLILYYIFTSMDLKHKLLLGYQAIQSEKGKLILRIEQEITQSAQDNLMTECRRYFNNDMDIKIISKGINRQFDNKFIDFISEI